MLQIQHRRLTSRARDANHTTFHCPGTQIVFSQRARGEEQQVCYDSQHGNCRYEFDNANVILLIKKSGQKSGG